MLLPSEIDTAGEAITYPTGGAAAVTPAEAAMLLPSETVGPSAVSPAEASVIHPSNELLVRLFQGMSTLRSQVEILQDQVHDQRAQIVTLTSARTDKSPVSQVHELIQKGILPDYTESCSSTGLSHDPVHTCSWVTHGISGEVITASSSTIKQARKNCARLYLAAFEQAE